MCTSLLNNGKTSKSFVHLLLSLLFPHRNSESLHIMSPHVFGPTACKIKSTENRKNKVKQHKNTNNSILKYPVSLLKGYYTDFAC